MCAVGLFGERTETNWIRPNTFRPAFPLTLCVLRATRHSRSEELKHSLSKRSRERYEKAGKKKKSMFNVFCVCKLYSGFTEDRGQAYWVQSIYATVSGPTASLTGPCKYCVLRRTTRTISSVTEHVPKWDFLGDLAWASEHEVVGEIWPRT